MTEANRIALAVLESAAVADSVTAPEVTFAAVLESTAVAASVAAVEKAIVRDRESAGEADSVIDTEYELPVPALAAAALISSQ